MIDRLREHFPSFEDLIETPLANARHASGWHVTARSTDRRTLGSGFHSDLQKARKIAVAEFIERSFFKGLTSNQDSTEWGLHEFPSACGFAAGFDTDNTRLRSTFEGLERWAMAQWIDEGCPMPERKVDNL